MDLDKILNGLNEEVESDGERLTRSKYEAVIYEVVDKFKTKFPQFRIEALTRGGRVILKSRGTKFDVVDMTKKTGEDK